MSDFRASVEHFGAIFHVSFAKNSTEALLEIGRWLQWRLETLP